MRVEDYAEKMNLSKKGKSDMGINICIILTFVDTSKETYFSNSFHIDSDRILFIGDDTIISFDRISSILVYPTDYVIAHYEEFKKNGIM